MNDSCGDNRFELIKKYKEKLIESTNIETDPEEMKVIDNILFRFWQMGWLDKLEQPSAKEYVESYGNTISRQAAINAVEESRQENPHKDGNVARCHENEHRHFLKILRDLPPAGPRWIPLSEKPPRGLTQVIVSGYDDSGDTPFDYTACGWMTKDGKYWIVDNDIDNFIVAWMPLPAPYKKENKK